ncbi:MAG: hypothetical protein PHO37_09450 [Kiritimatiellae bacterium]|nr:hypothetical protein [Kiritimatiellia bacterium]
MTTHLHNPPSRSDHAKAVLLVTAQFAEQGYAIITSNTDEQADPQIFAQNNEMNFCFYFIRANPESAPDQPTLERWRKLTQHHQVDSFYIPVNLESGKFDIIPLNP